MIVTGISNRYTIKPVFTPTNIERKTYLPVQKNDVYTPTFQSTLDDKIDKSYDKLTKQLGIINGLDVALMANRIQTKVPEVSKENIYYALGVLSQYSSYKSWTNLERGFDQIGVKGLDNLNLYENNEVPVYLNTVISYLAEKNYSNMLPKFERQNNAVILDSKLLAAMEKKPEILNYIKKCDYTPIYIDNFENGYNFLVQNEDFETFALEKIKQAKGKNFRKNLHYVLNGENIARMRRLGLNPQVIFAKTLTHPSEIADNLNPILIERDDFSDFIKNFGGKKSLFPELASENALDMLDKMGTFVSPRQFCEDLKEIHQKITSFAEIKGFKNIYYTIPDVEKSFGLVNYIYQKVNNISDEKFLYSNFGFDSKTKANLELSFLPDKTLIVVLDDCAASGSSLTDASFHYKSISEIRSNLDKEINFIIAPLYSTEMAKNTIKKIREKNYCCDNDAFLTTHTTYRITNDDNENLYENALVAYLGNDCMTMLVLPYMGPDTNNTKFHDLYNKMLYKPEAQKFL